MDQLSIFLAGMLAGILVGAVLAMFVNSFKK